MTAAELAGWLRQYGTIVTAAAEMVVVLTVSPEGHRIVSVVANAERPV